MNETEIRSVIVDVVRRLEGMGYNHGKTGNVSVRGESGFLITPTGANSENLTAAKVVAIDRQNRVSGEGVPSSEWHMHSAILEAYPGVKCVVHTHSDACVALSCLRKSIPAFHYMVAGFGGSDVRCARYATFGTAELAATAVKALAGRSACLLANHGMIATGRTVQGAFDTAVKLETLARQYLLALQAGKVVLLSAAEMKKVRARYVSYGVSSLPAH